MWKNRNLRSLIEGKRQNDLLRDFTTTPLPIPKIFLVVYLLNLRSECLVSYDPHFGKGSFLVARILDDVGDDVVVPD